MTFDVDQSTIYGLEHQSRAMASIQGDVASDRVAFVIGTQSLKFNNQICFLEYDEESHHVTRRNWAHTAGEIWHLSSCPQDSELVASCFSAVHSNRIKPGCCVWRLRSDNEVPNESHHAGADSLNFPASSGQPLELVSSIVQSGTDNNDSSEFLGDVRQTTCWQWQPSLVSGSSTASKALLLADSKVAIFDAKSGTDYSISAFTTVESKLNSRLTTAAWSPHHNGNTLAVATDGTVHGYDIRTLGLPSETSGENPAAQAPAWSIPDSHSPIVRSLDFNPNRQYYLATGGDDCSVKIWDVRLPKAPLSIITGSHSHWVWCVRYNPVHDQLLLTCSSDARLVLHCASSHSSEVPILTPSAKQSKNDSKDVDTDSDNSEDDDSGNDVGIIPDGIIKSYDEHEESVYCCEWSAGDAWVFASLSYDGRVIINKVPDATKYAILDI